MKELIIQGEVLLHNNFKNLTILYVEDDLEIQSNIKKF